MLAWALAMLTLGGGELRWQAPPGQCPSAETVQGQIDAAGGLGELQVDAVITADPSGGWRLALSIVLEDASDVRTLRDADCDALAEAAVLLVATRLDPERAAVPSPPNEPPPLVETPTPQLAPTVEASEPELPKPVAAQSQPPLTGTAELAIIALPTGLTLATGAGISLGTVPAPGLPSELAVGYAWPNVRLAVRGRLHVATPQQIGEAGSIRILVGTAGPQVCARPRWRQVEFPLCGEVGLGGTRAVTRGPARDRGGAWIEAGVGAGVAWFVDPQWALTAHLAGAAPLVGFRYAKGDEELWNPSAVAGRVMLGVEFLVPIQIGRRPEKP